MKKLLGIMVLDFVIGYYGTTGTQLVPREIK